MSNAAPAEAQPTARPAALPRRNARSACPECVGHFAGVLTATSVNASAVTIAAIPARNNPAEVDNVADFRS